MKNERQIEIMGIVNLTDDSYFADSRCSDVSTAISRIETMLEERADIIDIGACSTRPGSVPIGADREWERLRPVLEVVRERFPSVRLSVDTYWSSVVRRTYDLMGDFIVNDISAGEDDPMMLPLVGSLGLEYVAMHKRGRHEVMHEVSACEDIVAEVRGFFDGFSLRAAEAGVKDWILDPGFGFGKTVEQNWELLSGLGRLKTGHEGHGPQVLVGVSRKSMIYKPLGMSPEESLAATQAAHMAALMNGADILRVHDVASARQTVSLFKYMV